MRDAGEVETPSVEDQIPLGAGAGRHHWQRRAPALLKRSGSI
jgi:hypothetical protein